MNLFIFNSNKIARILVFVVVLFVFYNVFLTVLKPQITTYANQWQSNIVSAQEYLYSPLDVPHGVILGSSLASRLDNELLQANGIYNLAFGGGSAQTGLEILKYSNRLPRVIYIETNVLFGRGIDSQMIQFLFAPVLFKLRAYIPALQEKYQPLNLLISYMKQLFGKNEMQKTQEKRDEKIYTLAMQTAHKEYQKPMENYESHLDSLIKQLEWFHTQDIEIVFFSMPIDELLAQSTRFKDQERILRERFIQCFMPNPKHQDYITSDGIHLLYESAKRFTQEFVQKPKQCEFK